MGERLSTLHSGKESPDKGIRRASFATTPRRISVLLFFRIVRIYNNGERNEQRRRGGGGREGIVTRTKWMRTVWRCISQKMRNVPSASVEDVCTWWDESADCGPGDYFHVFLAFSLREEARDTHPRVGVLLSQVNRKRASSMRN